MAGIYVHIPFCRKACFYCDFHFTVNLKGVDHMVDAIVDEVNCRSQELKEPVYSVYFGGGTPSVLTVHQIRAILNAIEKNFNLQTQEVTLEVNPDDVDRKALKQWKDAGINRLSIGVQSFFDNELLWMNRSHNAKQSLSAVEWAHLEGFEDISIDLIYGIPISTQKHFMDNVHKALALPINHLSAYHLTLEDQTPYARLVAQKKYEQPLEVEGNEQFKWLRQQMNLRGWEHYEISNFCKPDNEAMHNSNYWKRKTYLGFGPGAHSFQNSKRRWNVSDNRKYIASKKTESQYFEEELLNTKDIANELIMTGLRTKWGVDLDELKKLKVDITQNPQFMHYVQQGLIEQKVNHIVLTEDGKALCDLISSDLFVL